MGGEMRIQVALGAVRLLRTFGRWEWHGRWENEKARRVICGRGEWKRLPGGESNRAKKRRHRYGGKDTAAQKKASQPYRMTGGATMRGVRVL